MKYVRVLLLLLLSLTVAADEKASKSRNTFDVQREELNQKYLEQLAALRKQYDADFLALQKTETAALKARQATAMKALNLDQANLLNADIQRVESQTAASQLRTLFVRNTSRGERAYFIRCPDGEWIERVVSRRSSMAYSYRLTAETPEYIELTHESGQPIHRLYDDRDLFRDEKKGKGDFVTAGRGHWEYSDAAARTAASQPDGTALDETPDDSSATSFSTALKAVTWQGIRGGWPEDFRFADNGQVITASGQVMPQRWVLVQPGRVITVNDRIIDSLTIDLEAGTLQSHAFSEETPKASWATGKVATTP
ncbi:MAG: hypothetical protein ACKO2P_10440 [Planctomycetota bacterium]